MIPSIVERATTQIRKMEDQEEIITKPTRGIEVLHRENYDALINLHYPDQEMIRSLLSVVGDGVPKSWKVLTGHHLSEGENSGSVDESILVDNDVNPQFLAKIRISGNASSWLKQAREVESKQGEIGRLVKRETYSTASLMNEFSVAQTVKDSLSSKEAQVIAANYGFSRIQLVEPLLGLIERMTGRKIMFYSFIDADTTEIVRDPFAQAKIRELENDKDGLLLQELETLFKRNSVFPSDLGYHQFMVAKDPKLREYILYLIDIEGYFTDPKGEFKKYTAI